MKRISSVVAFVALVFSAAFAFVPGTWEAEEPNDLKARHSHKAHHSPKVEFASSGIGNVYDEVAPLLDGAAAVPCTAGVAGPYPCENVDLLSIVPLGELGGAAGNDSWGWTDPDTDREIAIMGTGLGTAFVDVTDPELPAVLGTVGQAGGPTTGAGGILWRDIKVDEDHAFIVTERGAGMQVVDLTQLRDFYGSPNPARELEVKAVYTEQGAGSFHNLAINEDTDTAFLVGGNFAGGLHMVDISDPANPTFAGAFPTDGYTHDVQCVLYQGPDDDYNGNAEDGVQHEICFASNEDSVTVVDVTDRAIPVMLTKVRYSTARYTHQGWLTPDQRFFVFNDEVDESGNAVPNTTTYIVEFDDLDGDYVSADVKRFAHATRSVDHNLYIVDDLIYEANYNAGLRVIRYTPDTLRTGELEEVGYFDVDPGIDVNQYGGAWNVYPFFESGTLIVSTIDEGMFLLRFNDPASS